MKASDINVRAPDKANSENYWQQLIEDFNGSNLTRSVYCRKHQINYDNFNYWYRKSKKQSASFLIPVKIESKLHQSIGNERLLSTLELKNGGSLHIYDKDVIILILSKMI